jgi:AcrR family transcriptional regulator
VPRPQIHPSETILDAARALALDSGAGAATIDDIARASGAPIGSIYHRFGSRDELFARLWVRAVRRSQASFLAAIERPDPMQAALAGANAILDFCEQERADARLLLSFRREDLIRTALSPALVGELERLNRPLERALARLARALHGSAGRAAVERTLLAAFDLPYGAARRHLIADRRLPPGLCGDVEAAVRAVLNRAKEDNHDHRQP